MREGVGGERTTATADPHLSFPSGILGSSMDNDLTSLSWLQNAACLLPAISAVPDAALALSASATRDKLHCGCY